MSINDLAIDMGATTVEEDGGVIQIAMSRYWYDQGSLSAETRQDLEGFFRHVLEGTLQRANCTTLSEAAWAVFFHRLRTDPLDVTLSVRYLISARMDREYQDCDTIYSFNDAEGVTIDQLHMNAQGDNEPREKNDVVWAGRILSLARPSRAGDRDI